MWTRLSTYHASREGGRKMEAGRDGVQHVHNGYVRQDWILLINPTGYIVPLARGHTASSYPVSFPKTRSSSLVHGRCSSAARSVPRPSILRFYEKAVSFYRDELCRREYRAGRCASLLYHSHYARLRQRRYRSAVTVPHGRATGLLPPSESGWCCGEVGRCRDALRGTTVRRLPRSRSFAGGGRCTIRKELVYGRVAARDAWCAITTGITGRSKCTSSKPSFHGRLSLFRLCPL